MNQAEYEETEPRRDVHIDSDQYDLFSDLQSSEESPFYQTENHNLFMFAVGYGRTKSMRMSTEKEHAFFGRTRLSEQQKGILEAVAIEEEETVQVVRDRREVFKIAEEYANAGVEKLHGRVFGPEDDSMSELIIEVKELYEDAV